MDDPRKKPEEYWKKKLTPEQYKVLREKGIEAPFTGKFYKNFENGMYECAACGNPLFSSDTKFDSDCGWPSFDRSLEGNVEFHDDNSLGMQRTEVLCKKCGGHLGHLFNDGPTKTGLRYCINSIALNFNPHRHSGERSDSRISLNGWRFWTRSLSFTCQNDGCVR